MIFIVVVRFFNITETRNVTPDRMIVPDLGITLMYGSKDAEVFVYQSGKLYLDGPHNTHPGIYARNDLYGYSFEGRLWNGKKILSFWYEYGDPNPVNNIKGMAKERDLAGYRIIFAAKSGTTVVGVCCPFEEIEKVKDMTFLDTGGFRWVWPAMFSFRKKDSSSTPYELSCKYWVSKIGKMDVAEYHILMYEE